MIAFETFLSFRTGEVRRKRLLTRVLTGASIGAGCAAWIFSGATAHMATFVMMLAIAQLEYFRTVMLTGVYPARRIALASMVAANACARWAPSLHELVLPLSGVWVMLWFLLFFGGAIIPAAMGLLLAAVRDPNPVIFLEHKNLHAAGPPPRLLLL